MKKLMSLLLAAALLLMMASCGSSSPQNEAPDSSADGEEIVTTLSGPVELTFWHCISNTTHLGILNKLIDDFNSGIGAEMGITVTATAQGSTADLYNATVGAIKANTAPDVLMTTPGHTADYLMADCVTDLTPYINDPNVGMSDVSDFYERFWEQGSSYEKEGMYSLPIHMKAEVLYYDTDFFAEHGLTAPTTWDEMIETSKKIKEITGDPAFGWDSMASALVTMSLQQGAEFTTSDGEILLFNYDDVVYDVIDTWKSCVDDGIWRLAGEDKLFSGPFANRIIPMYIGVTTESAWIAQKQADDNFHWAAVPIPQYNSDTPAVFQEGHCIEILNQSNDPEKIYAAWEFIKYMTSYDANLATACGSGYMPIRKSVAEDPVYLEYIETSGNTALVAGTEQANAYYISPAFVTDTYTSVGLWTELQNMMNNILNNGVAPEDALNQLKVEFQS